jgi:AI-2 transport protein TqsA
MRKFRSVLDMIPLIKKHVPRWAKTIVSAVFLISIVVVLGKLIQANIGSLVKALENDRYQFNHLVLQLEQHLPWHLTDVEASFTQSIGKLITGLIHSISSIVQSAFVILLYVIFIVFEESSFRPKLQALFPSKQHFDKSFQLFTAIEKSVTNYIGLKTLIAFIAASLAFTILYIIGIDAPFFWALIIFIMNFIPTIGALIGTLFPVLFAFMQFNTLTPGLMILLFVGSSQLIVGNFLEPRLMGNSLNVSPLAAIFALAFWGAIWGITGMFLSVPITVIMVIVFSQFPRTRSIAILLSEKGTIENNQL